MTEASLGAERVRLMRDALINCSGFLVSGAVGVLLMPLLLKGLGAQAYGLWLAALAVGNIAAVLDFGLEWSVTREVAAAQQGAAAEKTERFVAAAGGAYVGIGVLGALLIVISGFSLRGALRLSAENFNLSFLIFLLAAISFFADQMTALESAVLGGLRRFDAVNKVSAAAALARAAGIVVLLAAGAGLAAVAAWTALLSVAAAATAVFAVARIEPRYRFRLGRFDWKAIAPYARTGFSASCASSLGALYWQIPQILLGVAGGAAWIAQYHIAQKFPLTILAMSATASSVFFPAASQHERAGQTARLREVLESGTRLIVLGALPLCLMLWIVAPGLLRSWAGETRPEMALILRLTALTVFVDALAAAALEVLWGCGVTRRVVAVFLALTLANLFLILLLLRQIGITGAAWGMLFSMAGGSLGLLLMACRACETPPFELMKKTFKGLLLPAAACAAATAVFLQLPLSGWPAVLGAALSGGGAYAAGLYFSGARRTAAA